MTFQVLPWQYVIIWAIIVTLFYTWRYRDLKVLRNVWGILIVFALNFFFFVWGVLILLVSEGVRYYIRKKQNKGDEL